METFTMSRKEVPRAGLVKAALAGKITNQEGARALRLTVRQFKRLKARFRRQGLRGLLILRFHLRAIHAHLAGARPSVRLDSRQPSPPRHPMRCQDPIVAKT